MKLFKPDLRTKRKEIDRGFTLVEMIISVGIFAMVMVFSVGALLQIMAANSHAQAIKTIMNNLNFALEDMTRTIKAGNNYDCDPSTVALENCASTPSHSLKLKDYLGFDVVYVLSSNNILKNGNPLVSPDVRINRLNFYVSGSGVNNEPPTVFMSLGGEVFYRKNLTTHFDVESFAVQRYFNK